MRWAGAVTLLTAVFCVGAALAEDSATADLVLEFQKEAAAHRTYLESLYSTTLRTVSIGIVVIGALLAFLGWRTLADVRDAAERAYSSRIEALLAEHAKELDKTFEEARARIADKLEDLSEAVDHQRNAVEGLIEAEGNLRPGTLSGGTSIPEYSEAFSEPAKRILWVDDVPSNNRGPGRVLRNLGAEIDEVLDTDAAMDKLPGDYDLVISDMGRPEAQDAGLLLLSRMRKAGIAVPTMIYASRNAVARTGHEAKALGAIAAVGGGPTELISRVKPFLFPEKS